MLCCILSFLSYFQDFWTVASLTVATGIFIWLKSREGKIKIKKFRIIYFKLKMKILGKISRRKLLSLLQSREPKFIENDIHGDIAKLILPTKNEETLEKRVHKLFYFS